MKSLKDYTRQLKKVTRNFEQRAEKQIDALAKAYETALFNIPIGPGPRHRLLRAVRKLRTQMNRSLTHVERALTRATAKKARAR